jgi:hypothetical protein
VAYDVQIAVDAAQPHVLADWWARALGWEVEPQDPAFIRRMIAEGYATDDDTTTHHGALVWAEGRAPRSAIPRAARPAARRPAAAASTSSRCRRPRR